MILWILGLSIISGITGRMGGAGKPFKSWIRDWICPLIALIALWLLVDFKSSYWWIYLITYILMGFSLTTYWDWLLKEDNLFFSGFVSGLALFPIIFTGISLWSILLRAFMLALIWGCLNKYLPSAGISGDKRILLWRRDIFEEFLRYASVVLTLFILLMR